MSLGGYFGQPCTSFYFSYSLYCKFNLIWSANKVVVVVVFEAKTKEKTEKKYR